MLNTQPYCRFILLISFLLFAGNAFATENNSAPFSYQEHWKKITRPNIEVSPESVLKEAKIILKQAESEKNTVQLIKANILIMVCTLQKEPDKASAQIADFESLIGKTFDLSDRALLQSMTAELYLMYYDNDSYDINKRTEILGATTGKLEQWTKNNYSDTICALLSASLQHSDALQKTAIGTYRELLEKGNSIQPTLYEFLANRKIDILTKLKQAKRELDFAASAEQLFLPSELFVKAVLDSTVGSRIDREIIGTFQKWLQFRLNETSPGVLIITDFRRIEAFKTLLGRRITLYENDETEGLSTEDAAYVKALETLASKHYFNVLSVIASEAQFYLLRHDDNDSIKKYFKRKAYELCADGIARFPKAYDVKVLKSMQDQILKKHLHLSNNEVAKPHSQLNLVLQTSNMNRVELKIYKVNSTAKDYYRYKESDRKSLSQTSILLESRWIKLNQDSNFNNVETIIPIKANGYGIYEFTLSTNEDSEEPLLGHFVVSDLAYMGQSASKTQYCVVDRVSGKPVPNVQINSYTNKWNKQKMELIPFFNNGQTDQNGLFEHTSPQNTYATTELFFEEGADKYLTSTFHVFQYNSKLFENNELNLKVLTDRSLYRPGQTVHFKAIAYFMNSAKQEVAANRSFEIFLLDANRKQIAVKTLRTNEFGSVADSFALPEDGLNGTFTLKANDTYTNFRVESYKRPTFEVTLERPETELHFGETIKMKGKVMAFAGFPISNATVEYKVVRNLHLRMRGRMTQTMISSGSIQTSTDGNFDVSFLAKRDNRLKGDQYYTYQITANVTDQKGETQQGENDISLGDKSLLILSDLFDKQKLDKSKEITLDVQLMTLNKESMHGTVWYELFRMKQSDEFLDSKVGEPKHEGPGTLVRSGSIQTKIGKLKLDVSTEAPGLYSINFYTLDNRKDTVRLSNEIILYDPSDNKPPVKTHAWMEAPKTCCSIGENAVIKFGSSDEDVHVLYQVLKVDNILESKWFTVSKDIKTLEIPYLSSYGDRVDVMFTFVKDEQLHTNWMSLVKKQEKRTLSPTLTVFRNKLKPGEKAEWTIHIPELLDKKRQAEILVGMYDASLDAIHPHAWSFQPTVPTYIAVTPWSSSIDRQFNRSLQVKQTGRLSNPKVDCKVDWMGLRFGQGHGTLNFSAPTVRGLDLRSLDEHQVVIEDKPFFSSGRVGGLFREGAVFKTSNLENPTVSIRENFNETAFFYPQLRTDEQGNVRFSFTVPESLTRWNLKMLAHTKNLFSGYADTSLVTQKDLMVQLNLPRFVRRSDMLVLQATVVNRTDDVQHTNVKLELIDPVSNKTIALKDNLSKNIELAARETKVVEWTLTEFASFELVVCKVVASSETFSDGEQRYLPVLPDQILVTETLPMTVRANQTKAFTFENVLKNSASVNSQSLTVEFTPNPAWYAVQALPSLSVPENKNAFDYFTAYYVNSLATHLSKSNPTLNDVFDQWKNAKIGSESLLSNLDKNKELKSMQLEETPWVLAAQNENQQKKQIVLLFDLNHQKQQNTQYWAKLLKLQTTSGGFAWFDGFPESRYVTHYILLHDARLNAMLKPDNQPIDKAILKAIAYIDNELAHDFDQLKKRKPSYETKMNIGEMQWFYLHVRSEYPLVPIPDFAKEAVSYYSKQAQDYWQEASLYGKAATALIANRNQNPILAKRIVASLRENAVKSDEMGMYWASNKAGYFWNQRPITIQTMLLEAFAEISKNTTELDEMKIWLLRQKQTQRWDSPLSTVDAIYALLHNGSDWISSGNEVTIALGSTPIEPQHKEAGTGYVKQTISGNDIKPQMGRANVTLKGTSGFGWGALYWQYFQDLKQVKQSGKSLTVSKNLFVEQQLPTGKSMIPIEKVVLKKGDKVITRLVVTVDRDMEFVVLKDLRAACFEPVVQRSGCVWKEGVIYYQTIKDASTQFFFSSLPKGSYVFEYEVWVNNVGAFTSGITTLQCQYAPEFSAHSGGERIVVWDK